MTVSQKAIGILALLDQGEKSEDCPFKKTKYLFERPRLHSLHIPAQVEEESCRTLAGRSQHLHTGNTNIVIIEEETGRREGKGRRCCLGGRKSFNPMPRKRMI